MVALHVKFDTQAEAHYFLDGLNIRQDRGDSCELSMRKGTSETTVDVPCSEGVASAPPTEEELSAIDRMSALPETVSVRGEIFHCLMPKVGAVGSRQTQKTLTGTWSAELPGLTGFTVQEGKFGGWNNVATLFPSRTEILFDGSTPVTLPPYLRLYIGPAQMFDDTNQIDQAKVRMLVDLQLVPLFDVSCDIGGEKC